MSSITNSHFQPKQVLLSLGILAALVAAGVALVKTSHKEEPAAAAATDHNTVTVSNEGKQLADIKTAVAEMADVQGRLDTTGMLSYPSDRTVKIAPRLQGRVRQVFVRVGDHVNKGQSLAILDSVDAATAQTTALQNDNKMRLATRTLERYQRLQQLGTPDVTAAEAALDQAKEGTEAAKNVLDHVKYQAKIGSFTDKPMEDAENAILTANSALSQAQADLILAQKDYERKKQLLKIGVVAQADMEQSQDNMDKATVSVQADEEALHLAQQALNREKNAYQNHLYADQQIEQSSSAYRQAVLQQDAAETARAQFTRDLAQAQSDYQAAMFDSENAHRALDILGHPGADGTIPVASPIDGIVTERDVSDGQVVDQSQMTPWQMFVVSDPSVVWVDVDVFEKDIASVQIGAPVEIRVAAVPNKVFAGKVLRIAPTLDKTSRAIKVRAEIDNRAGDLLDGEFANVSMPLGDNRHVLVVPLTAVEHEGNTDFVFKDSGDKFTKTKVKLGLEQGQRAEIVSGLQPGDKIASDGALYLGGQNSDD